MQCNAMQHNAMQCNAMQCNAMQHYRTLHNTTLHNTTQHSTAQHRTQHKKTQCNTIQYIIQNNWHTCRISPSIPKTVATPVGFCYIRRCIMYYIQPNLYKTFRVYSVQTPKSQFQIIIHYLIYVRNIGGRFCSNTK